MMQEEALRRSLERRLGRRYNEPLWSLLVHDGYVSEVVELGADPKTLYERAEVLLDYLQPRRVRSPQTTTEAPSSAPARERAKVLSDLVAHMARRDPEVVRFRNKYLGDGLIPWPDLSKWLKESNEVAAKTIDITITIKRDDSPAFPQQAGDLAPMLSNARISKWQTRVLDYAIPGDRWVHRIPVSDGTMLDSLRALSESISKGYGWEPAQATVFAVSNVIAYIDPIRATGPSEQIRNNTDMAWTRRIKLDIDPTLTPDEVAATYQSIREAHDFNRLKPMSAKHLRLASFTGVDSVELKWQERFQLWNRLYPAWKYSASSNFRRDAIRAQYRVLYPGRHRGSTPIRDGT